MTEALIKALLAETKSAKDATTSYAQLLAALLAGGSENQLVIPTTEAMELLPHHQVPPLRKMIPPEHVERLVEDPALVSQLAKSYLAAEEQNRPATATPNHFGAIYRAIVSMGQTNQSPPEDSFKAIEPTFSRQRR